MRKPWVRLVAAYLTAFWLVSALVTFQQPVIGTVHAAVKESKKEPRILGNASTFVKRYKKLQELGEIKKVVTSSSQGTKQLQISYHGLSGKLSGAVNADGSLRTMTYQAKDYPYYTQQTLNQMEKNKLGERGVTVAKTLRVFVDIFSPNAKEAEKEKVYGLLDPTPRLSPGKAIWRVAAAGSIMYSLHVTKEGVCTIKVWSESPASPATGTTPAPVLRIINEPTRYVFHYGGAQAYANTYPEHYDTAELIRILNGVKSSEKVAIIRLTKDKSDFPPLYAVFSVQSGTLFSLYDSTLASNAKVSGMSEDKGKFVFDGSIGSTLTLYVADLMNQKLARYDLPRKDLTNSIMDVEWIDNHKLGVEGHLNPYFASYSILDISSGIWSEPLYGNLFTWTKKGLFYVESVPNSNGGKSIKSADGTVIYSIGSEDSRSIVNGLWFNAGGDRIVFLEQNDINDRLTLVVATLDGIHPLHIDQRIPFEGAVEAIEWKGEYQIEISPVGSSERVTIQL